MKLYMLVLSGQGDTNIKFIEEEAWDWMQSLWKNRSNPMPKKVLEDWQGSEDYVPGDIMNITSGSAVNDAALQLPAIAYKGKLANFSTMLAAMSFIKEHDIQVVEEWQGCIY